MSCIQRNARQIALPGTKALIAQQIKRKTKYILGTKGLPEEQQVNACGKAYAEVWQQMRIVLINIAQCGMQITTEFSAKIHEKACRNKSVASLRQSNGAVHAQNDSRSKR